MENTDELIIENAPADKATYEEGSPADGMKQPKDEYGSFSF